MLIVAKLRVRRAECAAFEEFERAAARLMREHGGAIERTVRVDDGVAETLTEIHLVRFENEAGFRAYRESGALAALRQLRERSVVETELFIGQDGPNYGAVR